jgi:hypothetical protein
MKMSRLWRYSCGILAAVSGLAIAPAHAMQAGVPGEFGGALGHAGPATPSSTAPAMLALSKQFGVTLSKVPMILLGQFDLAAQLAKEVAQPAPGKSMWIGAAREIGFDGAMGQWYDVPADEATARPAGRLWVVDVRSPGAMAVRLLLTDLNLPSGAIAVAYSPEDPTLVGGPWYGNGNFNDGTQYTPSTFGDTQRLELFVPVDADRPELPLNVSLVQHMYRDPMGIWKGEEIGGTPNVGTCHNDVTCSPAWANVARAVAGVGASSAIGTLYCTGNMIATVAQDNTPYFLTASHCQSTQAAAQSTEVYWLYQTATCNGTVPSLTSRPRTSGATLIATQGTSDSTLLRLTGTVPGGLFFAGWATTASGTNTPITAIHHPDGSWKRISFGNSNDQQSSCGAGAGQSAANSVRAFWTSAVTEPGSSGSGLFRNDTQQLIGVLSCGPSFCGAPAGSLNDTYGRFASFYPTVQTQLQGSAPADDALEQNDTCATARVLTGASQNLSSLVVFNNDEDWYRFSLPAGNSISVTTNFTHASGNINMELFTTCGGSSVRSSISTTNSETFTYTNTGGAAQDVNLRVFMATGQVATSNTYQLVTSITAPTIGENVCASATVVVPGTYVGTTAGATQDGTATCITTQRPDVWFRYTAPAAGTLTLNTCGSAVADTVLSVHSACPGVAGATQLACNDDALSAGQGPCAAAGNRTSFVSRDMASGESVLIRVAHFGTTTGGFTLNVGFTALGVPNDTCGAAIAAVTGANTFNNSAALTEGTNEVLCNLFGSATIGKDMWYTYTAASTGDLIIDTCGSGFDTRVAAYSSCPVGADTALACDDDNAACGSGSLQSRIVVSATQGATYRIRVGGYVPAAGATTSGAGVLNISGPATTAPVCLADVGSQGGIVGPDGQLDNNDFAAFITAFFNNDARADVGGQGGVIGSDGAFDNNDFAAFITLFFAGCP